MLETVTKSCILSPNRNDAIQSDIAEVSIYESTLDRSHSETHPVVSTPVMTSEPLSERGSDARMASAKQRRSQRSDIRI